MPDNIIIVRQTSALRNISAEEAVAALDDQEQRLDRQQFEVPTAAFKDAIDQGDWDGQSAYLREHAGRILAAANTSGAAAIHVFSLAEVPHIIGLGAFMSNERMITLHDHDRNTGTWRWPSDQRIIQLKVTGEETLTATIKARGPAVIRVSISGSVDDADVRAVVGDEVLADITITHSTETPSYGVVKSAADVAVIAGVFRTAYARLRAARPNIDLVHLFVAAPASVCFAVGQELSLRNGPPVQTYRFRKIEGQPSQQPAIRLSSIDGGDAPLPLTEAELRHAAHIRNEVWPTVLKEIETYAINKKNDGHVAGPWYTGLMPKDALKKARCFPSLPTIASFLPQGAKVSPEAIVSRDYAFEVNTKTWKLNDRLLLALDRAVGGDEAQLKDLIRLFLFHEYVHTHHSIGKHTAEEVGKFANCLEHLDYTADTFALLSQLDFHRYRDGTLAESFDKSRAFLADQIALAIKSYWAFDESTGNEWQVRRIRRYMNWYWRLVQIENAEDFDSMMMLFSRQPHIEIGGLYQVARGRRVVAFLDRLDETTHLELAVVLENEVLYRQSDSPNTNLSALLESFRKAEHQKILEFFRSLYDMAKAKSGVQPVA